jgi:hypothetical protein
MVDDPGLKPLRDKFFEDTRVAQQDPRGAQFGIYYFADVPWLPHGTYQPMWFQMRQPQPQSSTFASAGSNDDVYFLTWKTEEKDAHVRTLDQARDDVIKAWRWQKARELADQAAKKLEIQARETRGNLASLKDLAARQKIDLIELGPMAKRMQQPALDPRSPVQYMSYRIPLDKINYPGKLAEQLLDMRTKEPGDTIVVSDAPKAIYYSATMTSKSHPSQDEFQQNYTRPMANDPFSRQMGGNVLLTEFEDKQRADFRKEFVKQLRSDAKVTTTPDLAKVFGSGSAGGGNAPSEE